MLPRAAAPGGPQRLGHRLRDAIEQHHPRPGHAGTRSDAARPVTLPVAVNADSLAAWLLPALAPLHQEVLLDLHRADQDDTAALLR